MAGKESSQRVAMVTGGASGIGAAIAKRLVQDGMRVVVADRDATGGQAKAEALGNGTVYLALDVASDSSWAQVLQRLAKEYGRLDVLVNNAGVTLHGSVESVSLDDWRRTLDIDLTGVFLGCRHAIALMKKQGGALINISSAYGLKADPDTVAYNAAKSALVLMSKSIALHCARERYDITCNLVHPGVVRTPMMDEYLASGPDPQAEAARWARMHPVGRLGQPGEIAAMVAYLASDEARFITGASFVVDGGVSL